MSRKWHQFIITKCGIFTTKLSKIATPVQKHPLKRYFDPLARLCHAEIQKASHQLEGSSSKSNVFHNKILHATAYESHGINCLVKLNQLY